MRGGLTPPKFRFLGVQALHMHARRISSPRSRLEGEEARGVLQQGVSRWHSVTCISRHGVMKREGGREVVDELDMERGGATGVM